MKMADGKQDRAAHEILMGKIFENDHFQSKESD
jgi:hypothetical protein